MAIRYKIAQYNNPNSELNGGYYARAIVTENMSLDDLAEHIQDHQSVYSKGTVKGVLSEMVSCIRELCLEGKSVTLDDLATFSVGLKSKIVMNLEDFSVANCVESVRLRARATGDLTSASLKLEASLKEMTDYDSPLNSITKSDDTTDSSTDDSGSSSSGSSSSGDDSGTSGDDSDVSV